MAATLSAIPLANTHSTDQTLLASTTQTASGTASGYLPVQGFTQAVLQLHVTAASGTTPTLDLYVQKRLPDASNYTDLAHFTQVTTSTGDWYISMVTGSNSASVKQDAAIPAGTVASLDFQGNWRLKWVISGTNPSYTFSVLCSLF